MPVVKADVVDQTELLRRAVGSQVSRSFQREFRIAEVQGDDLGVALGGRDLLAAATHLRDRLLPQVAVVVAKEGAGQEG